MDEPKSRVSLGPPQRWILGRRLWLVLLTAAALLGAAEWRARVWLDAPDLALRNEGTFPTAVPYMLRQIGVRDGFNLAWVGSSVQQGILNTTPDKAVPMRVQHVLRKRGLPVNCFNLSLAGSNSLDNYALAHAAMERGADAVVFEIAFSVFFGRGRRVENAKPELAYLLRNVPDFADYRREVLGVEDHEWYAALPGLW
ncbi:MAG: hypothetical protein JRI55_02845, partial [Deltaproteobacteria bacterium]|nr:hypothetical protein [Deltaproteobacteria bacterium]